MQAIQKIFQQGNSQTDRAGKKYKPGTPTNPTKSQYLAVASQLVPGFEIDDFNRELLRLLYAYATRDSYFTEQGYALDKGLLLYGNVGSGKTGQMKILQRVLNLMHSPLAFAYTTVSAVSDSFGANGFEAFLSYGQRNWMFDELGRLDRETVQYFGNKINVAESLIQNRYELFTRGYLSHFTTNLSKAQMAESYDERVWSRLQEMCNVIRAAAPDRRPNATPKPLLPVVEKKETPAYTDEMKKETILSEARKLQEGAGYLFLDAGGVHFEYLMARGVITTDALADAEAEEMVRLIKNVRSNPPGKLDRAAFLEFEQAEELPPGNKYTKELRYRVEKRVLRETIEQIAKNRLTI